MLNYGTYKRNRSVGLAWLLMLALLLGQSLALAHDHDADHGTETECALCVYSHLADDFVLAAADVCSPLHQPLAIETVIAALLPAVPRQHFRARAPPVIS